MFSLLMLSFVFIELLLFILLLCLLPRCYFIYRYWDFSKSTQRQYAYERSDHLVSLLCLFILATKIILLPFFVRLLDQLSERISGAMCGAGVLSANEFGVPVMQLKLAVVALSVLWLLLNKFDIDSACFAFLKKRYCCFFILAGLMLAEFVGEFLFFSGLDIHKVVLCCNAIFGVNKNNAFLLGLSTSQILVGFYVSFIFYGLAYFLKKKSVVLILTCLFSLFSYYSFTLFFCTYIYEIPTHQCPYCIFQADYYYIGYVVWGLLFSGLFIGASSIVCSYLTSQNTDALQKYAFISHCAFIVLCTYFVVSFYLRNGVFL
ncbi:hypothetical protein PCNPT3_12105 [Psychromonas sp. CNPT3]|uniref:hypothetical protein n=1 Tax=Psychromonas sp. CNPT3 TaxID=314282 RepID=UPI00006E9E44|nr:hypothetical protein [Psychromonas sp. CNPT3]AGH82357.1 hypothetical protein PCNPT3_12105 [Psychromonas sp. CNPT3]